MLGVTWILVMSAFHWDDLDQDQCSKDQIGSSHIKGTDGFTLGKDSSVPSIYHDLA